MTDHNKFQALHDFWNSFDIPAYESTTVPDDHGDFYITYEATVDSLDRAVPMSASVCLMITCIFCAGNRRAPVLSRDDAEIFWLWRATEASIRAIFMRQMTGCSETYAIETACERSSGAGHPAVSMKRERRAR